MRAGALDRRIVIERALADDDGANETEIWVALRTVWAQFIPSAGKEARAALGQDALLPASFRIRWSSEVADVGPRDRVRYPAGAGGRVYDIKAVVEIGRREGIELITVARDAAA